MNLTGRTVSGMIWAYAGYWGRRVFNLITTAILARLLIPEDFGLIGFALIVLNLIEELRGFGVSEALIYNDEEHELTNNTAFFFNTGFGILQYVLAFGIAPLGAYFLQDARIVDVIRVMALTLFFNGVASTHLVLLRKELNFRQYFIIDVISAVIKGVVSIVLALSGYGVWALVWGQVIGAAARGVIAFIVFPWVPGLNASIERLKSLWSFGIHVVLINLMDIGLEQADQLFIATMLGAVQLGYYTIAARLPELVIANFSLVLTSVLFPAYTRMKDNREALLNGLVATTRYTSYVTIGAGIGLALIAPEAVPVLFGDQWEPAIPLFRILGLLAMMMTLPWAVGDGLKAIGRPDVSTKLMLFELVYTFGLIYLFVSRTPTAVAASTANLITSGITAVLRLVVISLFFKTNPLRFFSAFVHPVLAAAAMAGVVTGWRVFAGELPLLVILIGSILLGGITYLGVLWLIGREHLLMVWQTLREVLMRKMGGDDDDEDADEDEIEDRNGNSKDSESTG